MVRLSLIGLGISDEKGVSVSGSERIREADAVFAEMFTSILREGSIERLSIFVGREIEVLEREQVEETGIVLDALRKGKDVCFLTAGDPLTATTHQDIRLQALKEGFEVEIINSGSIFTAAAGYAGLQHYKFGRTTTLPFPEDKYFPTSPLEVIAENLSRGLHTLVLLDIQAQRGRFMTASEGCSLLLEMERTEGKGALLESSMAVAVLRAGRGDWKVLYGELSKLKEIDMGAPPHCLIIPGRLHFMEEEMLGLFRI